MREEPAGTTRQPKSGQSWQLLPCSQSCSPPWSEPRMQGRTGDQHPPSPAGETEAEGRSALAGPWSQLLFLFRQPIVFPKSCKAFIFTPVQPWLGGADACTHPSPSTGLGVISSQSRGSSASPAQSTLPSPTLPAALPLPSLTGSTPSSPSSQERSQTGSNGLPVRKEQPFQERLRPSKLIAGTACRSLVPAKRKAKRGEGAEGLCDRDQPSRGNRHRGTRGPHPRCPSQTG